MDYEVTLAGKPTGKAQAEKQGLYYHVVCRCRLSGDVMYRLECSVGEKKTNLGILVRPGYPVPGEPGGGGRTPLYAAAKA